tara:strand:- start:737 stop:916 length:180 start_codon:yes stop_codon:yes gene_type:complete
LQLLDVDDEDMHKYIVREMMTLRRIRHPNIVQLIGLSKHESGMHTLEGLLRLPMTCSVK